MSVISAIHEEMRPKEIKKLRPKGVKLQTQTLLSLRSVFCQEITIKEKNHRPKMCHLC